jgi:hypothetical protein
MLYDLSSGGHRLDCTLYVFYLCSIWLVRIVQSRLLTEGEPFYGGSNMPSDGQVIFVSRNGGMIVVQHEDGYTLVV